MEAGDGDGFDDGIAESSEIPTHANIETVEAQPFRELQGLLLSMW
jgi:hypothetical protein